MCCFLYYDYGVNFFHIKEPYEKPSEIKSNNLVPVTYIISINFLVFYKEVNKNSPLVICN